MQAMGMLMLLLLTMSKESTEVPQILQSVLACLWLALLASCASGGSVDGTAKPAETAAAGLPGADRDEHGCIGSAGYLWCAQLASCVRPWEVAEQEGIQNDAEHFENFCAAPVDDINGK